MNTSPAHPHPTRKIFPFPIALVLAILCSIYSNTASAHDGGFGHSRRTIFFDAAMDQFILEYRLTHTSDEALLEMTHIDANGDGEISSSEQESYFGALGIELANRFDVTTTDNTRLRPRLLDFRLQSNLVQLFRYSISTTTSEIRFVDGNFPHKPGTVKITTGTAVKAELAAPTDLNHAEQVSLKVMRVPR